SSNQRGVSSITPNANRHATMSRLRAADLRFFLLRLALPTATPARTSAALRRSSWLTSPGGAVPLPRSPMADHETTKGHPLRRSRKSPYRRLRAGGAPIVRYYRNVRSAVLAHTDAVRVAADADIVLGVAGHGSSSSRWSSARRAGPPPESPWRSHCPWPRWPARWPRRTW